MSVLLRLFCAAAFAASSQVRVPPVPSALALVPPLSFHPMQIPVGMREVDAKEADLRAMKPKELDAWLRERAVPYVVREGEKRPIDRHHETRAAWQAGLPGVYAYSAVTPEEQTRLDSLSDEDFWAEMKKLGWFYDRDERGQGPREPVALPADTRGHTDDPYRSVAWAVRKKGGFDKTSVPFAEFQWANFFRERLGAPPKGDKEFDKRVKAALDLAESPAASHLPGYKGRR